MYCPLIMAVLAVSLARSVTASHLFVYLYSTLFICTAACSLEKVCLFAWYARRHMESKTIPVEINVYTVCHIVITS